jgi:hypothetical protein
MRTYPATTTAAALAAAIVVEKRGPEGILQKFRAGEETECEPSASDFFSNFSFAGPGGIRCRLCTSYRKKTGIIRNVFLKFLTEKNTGKTLGSQLRDPRSSPTTRMMRIQQDSL